MKGEKCIQIMKKVTYFMPAKKKKIAQTTGKTYVSNLSLHQILYWKSQDRFKILYR